MREPSYCIPISKCASVKANPYSKPLLIILSTFILFLCGINLYLFSFIRETYTPERHRKSDDSMGLWQTRSKPIDARWWLGASNVPVLVHELMRINHSVHNDLIYLDQRRRELDNTIQFSQSKLEQLRTLLVQDGRRFMRLKATISSHENHLSELMTASVLFYKHWPNMPKSTANQDQPFVVPASESPARLCSDEICLNWDLCGLQSGFLRVCTIDVPGSEHSAEDRLLYLIQNSPHYTSDCTGACLTIAFTESDAILCLQKENPVSNCLYLVSSPVDFFSELDRQIAFTNLNADRLIIAAAHFPPNRFRPSFDISVPLFSHSLFIPTYDQLNVPLLPGRRPILLTVVVGRHPPVTDDQPDDEPVLKLLRQLPRFVSDSLVSIHLYESKDDLDQCWPIELQQSFAEHLLVEGGWFPCSNVSMLLKTSTFSLILNTFSPIRTPFVQFGWQAQLVTSLASGAIPIILGDQILPFSVAIPPHIWARAIVRIPKARLKELPIVLQSISESHLVEMRRQGQMIYNRYFRSQSSLVDSLFLAVSRRLGFPQPPAKEMHAKPMFRKNSYEPSNIYDVSAESADQVDGEEFLGPVGPETDSPQYVNNFTSLGGSSHYAIATSSSDGEVLLEPFRLFPSHPWDAFLPADAAFSHAAHTKRGFLPINHSINSPGIEFNLDLGGMHPYEQFTIVILAYNRFEVTCQTLERLIHLPYLHSVVIVWNNPVAPAQDMKWPQLHVPLKVVRASNNSLNNRFIPYDIIRTDCILSIDDDVQLRHDEIIFGFRVWRQSRDQLVGFPVRSNFWNATSKKWYYHSDYTCEFSMILTGAAFFHKYYSFAYTVEMPFAVRQLVDKYMNCEDLAMNFLISHLTRKPPVKVTARWSFSCPTCPSSLHKLPHHYSHRSDCLNWLTEFYGYNPLIYTQYRADSVLYKNAIPMTKQRCYQFV